MLQTLVVTHFGGVYLGVEDMSCLTGEELHNTGTALVFLNGSLLGVHRRPHQLLKQVRYLRRLGKVCYV